jgi:hypothetical protein
MEKHVHFPEGGFRQETLREKLSHIFTGRAYRAADVRGIRSSVYYRNFHVEGANHKYEAAVIFADRAGDGMFHVRITRAQVSDNILQSSYMTAFPEPPNNSAAVICGADSVVDTVRAMVTQLQQESDLWLRYPNRVHIRLRDSVHIDIAEQIFKRPQTAESIGDIINNSKLRDALFEFERI